MKKYYTHPKNDPSSDEYVPSEVVKRPLISDNEVIDGLRKQVYKLEREAAKLKDPTPKLEREKHEDNTADEAGAGEGDGTGNRDTIGCGLDAKNLQFVTVEATAKSKSGGIISKPTPQTKAAKQKAKVRALQASNKKDRGSDK